MALKNLITIDDQIFYELFGLEEIVIFLCLDNLTTFAFCFFFFHHIHFDNGLHWVTQANDMSFWLALIWISWFVIWVTNSFWAIWLQKVYNSLFPNNLTIIVFFLFLIHCFVYIMILEIIQWDVLITLMWSQNFVNCI